MKRRHKPHWSFWVLSPFLLFFIAASMIASIVVKSWHGFLLFLPLNVFCLIALLITLRPAMFAYENIDRFFSSPRLKIFRPFWDSISKVIGFVRVFGDVVKRVEWDTDGFYVYYQVLPFKRERMESQLKWDHVREIDACMLDCFSSHDIAICFVDDKAKEVAVFENVEKFPLFIQAVAMRFDGFNQANYDQIEGCFPWEISLPCWKSNEPVETLVVKNTWDKIEVFRETDNSLFMASQNKDN